MIKYNEFVENSRKWLKEYIQKNRLKSVCIGVSGGIDSSVSCALASSVCQELNIPLIGRSLPTTTNKIEESQVAIQIGEAFCADFKTVNISDECEMIIHNIEQTEGQMTALQKGNIKARYRMIYLRNLASIHNGIVLDNDNFTEWNLGFWTVGGDSPMDVNLGLHYLWKTEIFELAKYLLQCFDDGVDEKKFGALRASLNLVPTDGNGVSNSDCEQFELDNYEQVDDVLRTMYYSVTEEDSHNGVSPDYIQLIDDYDELGVDKVMILHQNTEYKRKPAPIIPTKKELGI